MHEWRKYWEDIGNSNLDDTSASHLSKISFDADIQIFRKQRFEKIIFDRSYNLLLDAGCGAGDSFVKFINKCNKIIGLDFALPMLIRAKKKFNEIDFVNGDALNLPFKNNTFDIYIYIGVTHYFTKDELEKSFSEFYRVIRSNGIAVVHIKNKFSIRGITRELLKPFALLVGKKFEKHYYYSPFMVKRLLSRYGKIMDEFSFDYTPVISLYFLSKFMYKIEQIFSTRFYFMKYLGVQYYYKLRINK